MDFDSGDHQSSLSGLLQGAGLPKGSTPLPLDLLPQPPARKADPSSLINAREILTTAGIPAGLTVNSLTFSPWQFHETRREMSQLLGGGPGESSSPIPSTLASSPGQMASLLANFVPLKNKIVEELENNLPKLLALNPSRREAVAQYLDRLAGHGTAPSTLHGNTDAAAGLRRWIDGPRSPAQNEALNTYFEEIALLLLGQALLLKSWSDRAIRPWSVTDLKDLNHTLNTALKRSLPPDREAWLLARQNIYSWYKPGATIQGEIWETFALWKTSSEGPEFLHSLLWPARQARTEHMDPQGYDQRFYKALWQSMPSFGMDPSGCRSPLKRNRIAFSPTLRDGAFCRATSANMIWVGLESSAFQLMVAELMQLWWAPATPPLWTTGTGLEAHTSDQLSLSSGTYNPKPSLLSRIAEMEACDTAIVLEERVVRTQGRSSEALRFKDQIDLLPYFKKLKAPGTSLGDLQACVALSKLRPGGLLWWAREEALTEHDGKEMLNFLLERAKIVCEWDFSDLNHALPSKAPLFPRHLYLLSREAGVEERLTHRPLRITLHGNLRSHIELPLVFEDAFRNALQESQADSSVAPISSAIPRDPRPNWRAHAQRSPAPQRDWAERWPDPTSQETLRSLELLREASIPLASATTIRPTPEADPAQENTWAVHPMHKGFWIHGEHAAEGRRLVAQSLSSERSQGAGFLVLVADPSWIAPLSRYLESAPVRLWLDLHAERKGERWVLNEQVVRAIPVPKLLFERIGFSEGKSEAICSYDLRAEEESAVAEILQNPSDPSRKRDLSAGVRTALFVRGSWELEKLHVGHGSFLALVTTDGRIRWSELLKMLPQSECVTVPLHSRIRLTGQLPLQLAIGRMERVRAPQPGILFATEAGFSICVTSDSATLLDMVWDQVQGLESPTWSELVSFIRVPRRIELAETTAGDVLRLHGDQSRRMRELSELLAGISLL